jgi:cell division septum initiation protein DivIVA
MGMDILHLVDRLEELFNESKPIWFTHSVIVDEDRMLDLIDQMRVTIPEEIKKSQQLLAQRDRILAQAQEEASRTIALAREKAEKIVEDEPITSAAKTRAEDILAQAQIESEKTKKDADDYVLQTLAALDEELSKVTNQVKNGILALKATRPEDTSQDKA